MFVWTGEESKCERLVVGVDAEVMLFNEVLEVLDGQIDGQQLTVEGTVLRLGRCEFPQVRDWTPDVA